MAALEALRDRIEAHLSAVSGAPVAVSAVSPLGGGACQEAFCVSLSGPAPGGPARLVLRSDAPTHLPGSLDRATEGAVVRAAHAAGVRTPDARWPAQGLVRPGAHAYFMDWVDGEALGARVVRHPALAEARRGLVAAVAAEAARIHKITPETHPELALSRDPYPPGVAPAAAVIALIAATLDRLPAPRPGAELALRWLRHHQPPPGPITLIHGDLRTGNLMVTPAGLAAVLDWEFAHWGDPAEDLGWLCVRDWRFGALHLPAGGFGTRAALRAAYAAAGGAPVDPARLHWWEVAGNLKWGAFAGMQGLRYAAGQADLELLAIPRRMAEMEFEALRLIDQGPDGPAEGPP